MSWTKKSLADDNGTKTAAMQRLTRGGTGAAPRLLGLWLCILLAVCVAGYVGFTAYDPQALAAPIAAGNRINPLFVYGLGLMAMPPAFLIAIAVWLLGRSGQAACGHAGFLAQNERALGLPHASTAT